MKIVKCACKLSCRLILKYEMKRLPKINDVIKKFEMLNMIFLLSRGKVELFATASERREYRLQNAL